MHITLRREETEAKYQEWLKVPLKQKCCFCRELSYKVAKKKTAIKIEWKYWALMYNQFPYDKVYETHDLLFCKRHVDWGDLTVKEITEYNQIMKELRPLYHQLVENIGSRISQPSHYHIHLCKFYEGE